MRRCPRCGSPQVHGNRQSVAAADGSPAPARVVEEYYCGACALHEAADSDRADYGAVQARWHRAGHPAAPPRSGDGL